ncbi:MAG: DivIVA domain-containing protein [Erysipelothrix sp.]|nr:DivIVA domain-containing protein [Erysipelothrix sp.]
MNENLKLNAEKIFNKNFSVDFQGYTPQEVDSFLDVVIQDYQVIEKVINEKSDENRKLKYTVATLEAEIIELKAKLVITETPSDTGNLDILKRLARLEEIILNK